MVIRPNRWMWACVLMAVLASPVWAQMKDVPHPFLLWTKAEAAAIKARYDKDPVAQAQFKRMEEMQGKINPAILNLFKYSVLGDQKAGEREKGELLKFIGKVPEPLTAEFKAKLEEKIKEVGGNEDLIWQRGMASWGDRHMRDEQTLNTLRYDIFYDELTPEQRAGVEEAMRVYIKFHLDGHKPWHPDFHYSKAGWLPNMSWPRAIGTHLMAAALKDEKAIAAMFNGVGGFKWYMDEYVSDGKFYCEEFAKYYSNIGTMLLWCEALERLNLPQYGYGYTSKSGASMKSFLEMFFWIGYPRTIIPGGVDNYRRVTMGDAKGNALQLVGLGDHSVVEGYLPGGKIGGDRWWSDSHMNGPFPKMQAPLWYEIGHRRFPDAGFGYFLAAMRKPGENLYLPSLYFGLGPIDPAKQKAPPAPSYFAYQRGFAFLRAEESPAYWESPAPAVALQTGFYYPHYAHDSFSLLGYHAYNRAIYVNAGGAKSVDHYVLDQIKNGPPTGYIARHPWKDTNRGHAGVTVDNLGPRPTETGEEGLKNHVIRSQFAPLVKFAAARTKNVFPDVTQERALFLAREYLLDVFWLRDANGKPRRYEWNVTGPGAWQYTEAWKPTSELNGSMLYRPLEGPDAAQPAGYENKTDASDLTNVHKLVPPGPWTATILQTCALPDVNTSKLGKAFYDRNVGVNISMLPEKGTTVFTGTPPGWDGELGGAAIIVRRETPATTFVALHEPFENKKPRPLALTRIGQSDSAVAVRVAGPGVNDRVLLAFGDKQPASATLEGDQESFAFTSHGHVRVEPNLVTVTGEIQSMKIKVAGQPKLIVNGKETPASIRNGILDWSR